MTYDQWKAFLEGEKPITQRIMSESADWAQCPVGACHPSQLRDTRWGKDIGGHSSTRLVRMGLQFMEAVHDGNKPQALIILQRIKEFQP